MVLRAVLATLGPKNADRKQTPYLVLFDELTQGIAEHDRMLVREIPVALAAVGLQVIRLTPVAGSRPDADPGV